MAALADPVPAVNHGDGSHGSPLNRGNRPHSPTVGPAPTVACAQDLISQQVVQQLPSGSELRITAGAKVTAMAQDAAGARSIRISREA